MISRFKKVIAERFGVSIPERPIGRILRERGFRKLSVRPKQPEADAGRSTGFQANFSTRHARARAPGHLERSARNTSTAISQFFSGIPISMTGAPNPVTDESRKNRFGNPQSFTLPQSVHTD
ncbi:MAG: helix-turn-helix domain-containing protein [Rhodomicrobium sp.]